MIVRGQRVSAEGKTVVKAQHKPKVPSPCGQAAKLTYVPLLSKLVDIGNPAPRNYNASEQRGMKGERNGSNRVVLLTY